MKVFLIVLPVNFCEIQHEQRFNELTKLSAEALKNRKRFSGITEDNFQQVPGGKIQMLICQNAWQDFFPEEVATFTCGLKVSIHLTKVHDQSRYLGFSGRFPAQFTTMYTTDDDPKASIIQDSPQRFEHEEESVFQEGASAKAQRYH